jgi:EmrB/QacA subfamily drug resistance transporter
MTAPAPTTPALDPRRWIGLVALLSAPFLGVVDFFVVNLAMPAIEQDLGASPAEQELVIAFYALAYSVFVVTGGRLGDTHGRKRVFLCGLSGFTAASILCGVATGPTFLLVGRLLQGTAASLLFPQVLALIQVHFPERERPTALALLGMSLGLASATGQLAGGLFLRWNLLGLGWRALFLINVPVGITALLGVWRLLHESRSENRPRLDLGGVALATAGLASLLVALVRGPEEQWPGWCLALLFLSAPLLWLFYQHERTATRQGRDPLVDLTLFQLPGFRNGLLVIGAYFGGGGFLFLPLSLYLQKGLHLDSFTAALQFLPFACAVLAASLVASRLAQARRALFLIGGMVLVSLGILILVLGLASGNEELTRIALAAGVGAYGFGHGCVSPVIYSAILRGIPTRNAGSAAGVLTTVQQVSSAFGVAGIGLLFFTLLDHRTGGAAHAQAAAGALCVNFGLMVFAGVLCLRLPRAAMADAVER